MFNRHCSPGLLGAYALFLKNVLGDFDQAEEMYQRSLSTDPNRAVMLSNYVNRPGFDGDALH